MSSVDMYNTRVSSAEEKRKRRRQTKGEWEVMPGLKEGEKYDMKPLKFDGYLHKKRNPPLKGWHRRYFVIEEGHLMYSKSPADYVKRRYHGKIDIGLSVLSFNKRKKKIDIDAEEFVCHIRTKNIKWFEEWVDNLRKHRLYRHNELTYGSSDAPLLTQIHNRDSVTKNIGGVTSAAAAVSAETVANRTMPHSSSGAAFVSNESLRRIRDGSFRSGSLPNQSKVIAWLIDNDGNEQCSKDFEKVQTAIDELNTICEKLGTALPQAFTFTPELNSQLSTESHKRGSISKILSFKSSNKKERKNNAETASQRSSSGSAAKFTVGGGGADGDLSSSSSISQSASNNSSTTSSLELCTQFISRSQQVASMLKNLNRRINTERDRLRHVVQDNTLIQPSQTAAPSNNDVYVQSLKQCVQEMSDQNENLKHRLSEVDSSSNQNGKSDNKNSLFRKISIPSLNTQEILGSSNGAVILRDMDRSHSLSSKASEMFFDASDQVNQELSGATNDDDDSSSVSTDSSSSSFSDHDADTVGLSEDLVIDDRNSHLDMGMYDTGHRSVLPAPMSVGDTSLISLLTKNIGKDLTRISMPVTLNEPLNTLQLLCEELEYSELLDQASEAVSPYERMMYVAAFAVSAYASTNTRAATKPFNPILGETYECIRLDKGWKFVAEQVSHHPPVSVCHADSENFVFKQDCRVKTKFWGKSMEFHPSGNVSVELPRHNETYEWRKVTTCVHNVLGGQRWVDQYGEMVITCKGVQCKLNFIKASYWSDKKHEVQGTIRSASGDVELYIFGKWTESINCRTGQQNTLTNKCIWRAGNLPQDHEMYYGFTRFAIELNEIRDEESAYLPITDTRFRPDQRLLEEGRVDEAESEKQRVEKIQREARKQRDNMSVEYEPRWFRKHKASHKDAEQFIFTEDYWKCKREPGFEKIPDIPKLW